MTPDERLNAKYRNHRRARRYAGDVLSFHRASEWDLPRGRYYALADPTGDDYGLLRSELASYSLPSALGMIGLLDGYDSKATTRLGYDRMQESIFSVLALETPLFREAMRLSGTTGFPDSPKGNRGTAFVVEFATVRTKLEIGFMPPAAPGCLS